MHTVVIRYTGQLYLRSTHRVIEKFTLQHLGRLYSLPNVLVPNDLCAIQADSRFIYFGFFNRPGKQCE